MGIKDRFWWYATRFWHYLDTGSFGTGRRYLSECVKESSTEDDEIMEVEAQGLLDVFRLTDKEVINKITSIIKAVDVAKVKAVMDMIEVDNEGWLHIKIDLRVKND